MTFNDDGTVNYTNSQGESKSFAEFNVLPQSFEGQNTFLALNDKFTNAKYSGKSNQWSMHSGEAETTVNALFQKLKPAGQKDMMMGDINYLEKTTGFQSGTDEYENAINGILENPNDAIGGYKQHMLETLENNYNAQNGPKVKISDKQKQTNKTETEFNEFMQPQRIQQGNKTTYSYKEPKEVEAYLNNMMPDRNFKYNPEGTDRDGYYIRRDSATTSGGEKTEWELVAPKRGMTWDVIKEYIK